MYSIYSPIHGPVNSSQVYLGTSLVHTRLPLVIPTRPVVTPALRAPCSKASLLKPSLGFCTRRSSSIASCINRWLEGESPSSLLPRFLLLHTHYLVIATLLHSVAPPPNQSKTDEFFNKISVLFTLETQFFRLYSSPCLQSILPPPPSSCSTPNCKIYTQDHSCLQSSSRLACT